MEVEIGKDVRDVQGEYTIENGQIFDSEAGLAGLDLADAGSGDPEGFGEILLGPFVFGCESFSTEVSADLGAEHLVYHVEII